MAGGLPALSTLATGSTAQADAATGTAVTQIRNATLHVDYAGVRFLIDPMLSERGAFPGFPGTPNSELRNPLVHLPFPVEEITRANAVILTHLHPDHWDEAASAALPKTIPVFTQNDADAAVVRAAGFKAVEVLGAETRFASVTLTRTGGAHAAPEILAVAGEMLGEVSGVVFLHPAAPTVYLAGDTVWNETVRDALATHQPEVVILNAGYAQITGLGPILMGAEDVRSVAEAAPDATLIATHIEAINHCILTRAELRAFAADAGFGDRLRVPGDGETIRL
ncbi:MBL fold metallo-hydrolase [Roseibacterium sp. KMU-115]|uniref:MBL fold metallo-hydrolase n=2 Tax=Roseicyclus persicicus TaxID=2650661 RepID=A0A7X6GY88_9RHOB|nr:MBL fold metallo-hydrolase [Roseibacterium persicicum]